MWISWRRGSGGEGVGSGVSFSTSASIPTPVPRLLSRFFQAPRSGTQFSSNEPCKGMTTMEAARSFVSIGQRAWREKDFNNNAFETAYFHARCT